MEGPLLDDELSEKDRKPITLFSPRILAISAGLLCFGLLFKVSHWPGYALMIMVGSGFASGHASFRAIILKNSPVERAMRAFIPLLALCILFFWLQFTLTAFWFFLGSGIIGAALDYYAIRNHEEFDY